MNKILISGANGFVGSNLCEYLKYAGNKIRRLARTAEADNNQVLWSNLDKLPEFNIDVIIHLAGKAHDLKKTSNPKEYFEINTDLTAKLFDHFLKSAASTFIFMSSVKAAADTATGILTEDVIPDPQTPYGQSKQKAEEYILSKILPQGKRVFILRPCMIHGPGNKGNLNLLYKFVKKGIPYPLAAFENKRSFLSIANLNFIIEKIINDPEIPDGIYNLADDKPLSTNEVIGIIAKTGNLKPKLWRVNRRLVEMLASIGDKVHLPVNSERLKKLTESYVVSNSKIKNALNITHLPVSSAEGLITTITSFLE